MGKEVSNRARHRLIRILAAQLVMAACTTATPRTHPSQGVSPGPRASGASPSPVLPAVSQELDRAPSECSGPPPRRRHVASAYGSLIGGGPLWGGVYARLGRKGDAFHAEDAPRTEFGWRIKVLWVIRPGRSEPVSIEGAERSTGERLWFEFVGEEPTTTLRLDPNEPGVPPEAGHWREFPSYLYFPRAGCYGLESRWPEGSWELGFGFGR
jgi:hypothetical protein